MKKLKIKTYIKLLIILLLINGCEKAPMNNQIEGMWRLEEYTTHEDQITHTCERIYYSIQLWMVEIAEKQGPHGYKSSIGRFIYEENTNKIIMKDFYYRSWTTDNKEATIIEDLKPYGLNNLESIFEIIDINKNNLVLRSDYATLRFTRF